ncbi:unnamed protein product [Paramecium pentaurelia]|uniref:PH domain-containing protein n=1 Tax=Paramecium pentaurelia TaxID=43138 RepID=A0A8S1X9S6_9CILI|nr:unnamed protein product [Paramecium pentaurelia]
MQQNSTNHEDGQPNNIVDNLEFQSVLDIQNLNDDQFQEEIQEQNNHIQESNKEQQNNLNIIHQEIQKIDEQRPQPELEGEFYKVSPHFLETNSTYYCTLFSRRFTYYNIKNKEKPLGILDFDYQKYIFSYLKSKDDTYIQSFILQPEGCEKKFEFVVPTRTREQSKQWVQLIQQYIQQSNGYINNIMSLSKYHRFWRHERILDPQILAQAQTGDLLIFRTRGTLQNLQRSITRSDYDHIVMFLKNPWEDPMLFESSNQYGVISFSYKRFVKAKSYKNYEKILYKPLLNVSENDRLLMYAYAEAQIGKGYSLSMMKFFKKSTRQNFFCSELIAYIYQLMGFIPETEKCCSFLPGNFTDEDKRLDLLKSAQLGPDYIVDFYYLQ